MKPPEAELPVGPWSRSSGHQRGTDLGRTATEQGGAGQHGRLQGPVGEAGAHPDRGCGRHHFRGRLPVRLRYPFAKAS